MADNFLQLNPNKTEVLIIAPDHGRNLGGRGGLGFSRSGKSKVCIVDWTLLGDMFYSF